MTKAKAQISELNLEESKYARSVYSTTTPYWRDDKDGPNVRRQNTRETTKLAVWANFKAHLIKARTYNYPYHGLQCELIVVVTYKHARKPR